MEVQARQTEEIEARERRLEELRSAASPGDYRPSRSPPAHLMQGQAKPMRQRFFAPIEVHGGGVFGALYRMRQSVWPSQPVPRPRMRRTTAASPSSTAAAAAAADSQTNSESS